MMVNISKIRKVLHQAFFRDIGEIFLGQGQERKTSQRKKKSLFL